jgi:hypothetical protein
MSPNAGGRGGGSGVSANENSCAHHVTWSPNKLWRSNSIFNLRDGGSDILVRLCFIFKVLLGAMWKIEYAIKPRRISDLLLRLSFDEFIPVLCLQQCDKSKGPLVLRLS